MQGRLGALLILGAFTFASETTCVAQNHSQNHAQNHTQLLREKFPFGLLGDDFGVLTTNDLAINACFVKKPKPFKLGAMDPYEYWQCFETKKIKLACAERGVSNKAEGPEARVEISVFDTQSKHVFFANRPWALQDCTSFLRDLKKLIKDVKHACISAAYIGIESEESGKTTYAGVFHRLKTKKGCEGDQCTLSAKEWQKYCPSRQTTKQ
jgi:hypothetical protein